MREDALNLPTYRCITISLNLDAESISVLQIWEPAIGRKCWCSTVNSHLTSLPVRMGTDGMRKCGTIARLALPAPVRVRDSGSSSG